MTLLSVEVRFLTGRYHGLSVWRQPEWPPTPLRLYWSLVAVAFNRGRPKRAGLHGAFRALARAAPPLIIAPAAISGRRYREVGPLNNSDHLAAAWARGREPQHSPQELTTLYHVHPSLLAHEPLVYLWSLPSEEIAAVIADEASHLVSVGRGEDMVVARGKVLAEPEPITDARLVWEPGEGNQSAAPAPGLFDELVARRRTGSHAPIRNRRLISYRLRERHMENPDVRGYAIVHIGEDGSQSYLTCGDVRLLVIDERAPNDRVYQTSREISAADLAALIGDNEVGSATDSRHAAIARRIRGDKFRIIGDV